MKLRITSGKWRNRTVPVPKEFTSRPTTDKVRQALFNILAHASWAQNFSLQGAVVVDGFAGTGIVGLEALSRDAKHCLFVDFNFDYLNHLQNLAEKWNFANQTTLLNADLTKPLPSYPLDHKPDLIFLDPPYAEPNIMEMALERLSGSDWFKKKTLLVIEQAQKKTLPKLPDGLVILDQRHYGITQLIFLYLKSTESRNFA